MAAQGKDMELENRMIPRENQLLLKSAKVGFLLERR
jgi:hypothetical protein